MMIKKWICTATIGFTALTTAALAFAQSSSSENTSTPFDHSGWTQQLHHYVHVSKDNTASRVDYSSWRQQQAALKQYLSKLASVDLSQYRQWPEQEQLAFLINAYNAYTIQLILDHPEVDSIKQIGSWFSSPWKIEFASLLGELRSLDDIEHQWIRSDDFREPRIHFAVNCASVGCPLLRTEAYTSPQLEVQLQEQTQRFLKDRSRNKVSDKQALLSPIFKWYRQDFENGWGDYQSLEAFLLEYEKALELNPAQKEKLLQKTMDIEFSDYDWSLNQAPTSE